MIIQGLKRDWHWPDADEKCRAVVFDWTALRHALRHCKQLRVAVQAGGNMGVWPWLLSRYFHFVATFEPDPRCFELLVKNLEGTKNVAMYNAALWHTPGVCSIQDMERNNLGAQYIVPSAGVVPMETIDSYEFGNCDLIYLDIEGAELGALQGAVRTIETFKPTIVVEDKGLSDKFGSKKGDIEKWLSDFGYTVATRYARDVVFTCE
jgi:FkbM family methyltransferase